VHVGDGIPTTIDDSSISRNEVSAVDPGGAPVAFDAAILIGHSPATISDTVIDGNRSAGVSASTADTGSAGSAVELDGGGTITRVAITRNVATQRSTQGPAGVNGALAILNFDGNPKPVVMTDSVIAGNEALATTRTGDAIAQGGGVFNDSLLTLRRVLVHDNALTADGPSGRAEGGGIWNSDELSGPPVELTLDRVAVTGNALLGGRAIARRGGGLYTTYPFTQTATVIGRNAPDQVFNASS
jgi:hypothetical protein